MKKASMILIALIISGTTLNAQWVELVTPTINYEIKEYSFLDLEISLEGEPYLLYDCLVPEEGGKLFVQKYNAASEEWSLVGTNYINELYAMENNLVIDSEGNIYVAFVKLGEGNMRCTVKKFDGTDWGIIGEWSAGINSDVIMYCDNQDEVYVSYFDVATYSAPVVKKYLGIGSDWETLGNAPFFVGQSLWPNLTTDNDGNVLVSFGNYYLSVKKYNGTSWEYVGNSGMDYEPIYPTSIITDNNDVVYATTTDYWTMGSWVANYQNNMWQTQYICDNAGYMPFAKYNNDVYMGHCIFDNYGYSVRIKKLDNSGNWIDIPEQPGVSTPYDPKTNIDIETDNYGNLYLAILKEDGYNHYVSVFKLDITTAISKPQKENYTIYPNPTSGIVNLTGFNSARAGLLGLEVTDITGKTIYKTEHVPIQIDLSGIRKGLYFLKIQTKNKIFKEKVIIQ